MAIGDTVLDKHTGIYLIIVWDGSREAPPLTAGRYSVKDERSDQMADAPIKRPNRSKRATA